MDDYKFTVLWKDDILADVELYDKRRKVRIKKHKNIFPENPFYGGEVTAERVYRFLEGRCMDRNRPCLPEYLNGLGLEESYRSNDIGFSSLGIENKYYKNGYWYKQDISGYEGLAEEVCSTILRQSNLREYVEKTASILLLIL